MPGADEILCPVRACDLGPANGLGGVVEAEVAVGVEEGEGHDEEAEQEPGGDVEQQPVQALPLLLGSGQVGLQPGVHAASYIIIMPQYTAVSNIYLQYY